MHLLKLPESRRENESADGVAISGGTVRVELTPCIAFGNIEARQVANTGDLNEIRSLYEMGTVYRPIRDETGSVAVLHAPRDFDLLGIANN